MPLHSNGARSVTCAKPNSVVYGHKNRTVVANFEENFKTEKNGLRKQPAVLVQRCDVATDCAEVIPKSEMSKPTKCINFTRKNRVDSEKIPKSTQNENFVCSNSVQSEKMVRPARNEIFTGKDSVNVEKITKCSVNVVKHDLEKLKASLSKASRGCVTSIKGNCENIANDSGATTVPDKNISCKPDAPDLAPVNSDVVSKNLDTSAVHADKIDSHNVINTPPVINKSKSRKLVTKPVHNRNNSPSLDIPTVHSFYYYKRKFRRWDIPLVLNGLKNLNLSSPSTPVVHSDVNNSNLVTIERECANVPEIHNAPVPIEVNVPQSLDIRAVNPDNNIPAVHNDVITSENLDAAEQSCTNMSENVDTSIPHQSNNFQSLDIEAVPNLNIDESLDKPLVYNGVKFFLNDKVTVKPNFNVSVVLVKADLKKLKNAFLRKKRKRERKSLIRAELKRLKDILSKEKQKKKRKHSKCIHRIKANADHNTFQYCDTPIIDSNGNISHFDNAIDSGISISPNSEASILESDINISPEYSPGINTGINTSKHSYTPIVDSERTIEDYDEYIFQDSYIPMLNAYVNSCVNMSKDSEPSIGHSAIFPSISLDSVTPITDSDLNASLNLDTHAFVPDLNISQSSNDTAIVGSDVNLSPFSDSSSYVESNINISQYSHTPIGDSDITQFADTSMLESDINFAQDAEGLMEAVMSIAQYAASSTSDSNLVFPRDANVPLEPTNTYRQEEPQQADVSQVPDASIVGDVKNIVNLKCKVCDKVYSDAKKLHYHEENKHIVYKPTKLKKRVSFSDTVIIHEVSDYHKCRKCGKIFLNYRSLKLHKKLKHKKRKCYICDYCSKKFVDRMFFKVHIKLHCDVCGKLMKNKKKYINHRKKVCRVLKLHKCKKCCGRFFKSMVVKDNNYENINSLCVCDICKDQFQSKCGVAQHISVVHCNNRSTSFYTMRNLGTKRLYLCNFCDYSSVDRKLIEKHVQLLPDLNNRSTSVYKDHYYCDQCLKFFKTESDMLHHKWTHFLKTGDNSQIRYKSIQANKKTEIKKVYNINEKLPVCLQPKLVLEKLKVAEQALPKPKTFGVNSGLKNKIVKKTVLWNARKTLISNYQCQICKRYYSNSYSLNRHVESIHSDHEHLQCKVCEEVFVWPSLLKSHKCIRLKIPDKPSENARPENHFDNLHEITPSFDDLNISESDDYLNSVDFDILTPASEYRQYDRYMCSNDGNLQPPHLHKYVSSNVQVPPLKYVTSNANGKVQVPLLKYVTSNANGIDQVPPLKYVTNNASGNVQVPPLKYVTSYANGNEQVPPLKYMKYFTNNASGNVQVPTLKYVTSNDSGNVQVPPLKYFTNNASGNVPVPPLKFLTNNASGNVQVPPLKYVTNNASSNVQVPPLKYVTNNASSNVQVPPLQYVTNNASGNVQVPSMKYVNNNTSGNVQVPPLQYVTNNASGYVQVPSFKYVTNNASGSVQIPPLKYVTNNASSNVQVPPLKYVSNNASGNVQVPPLKYVTTNNASGNVQVPSVKYVTNNTSDNVQVPLLKHVTNNDSGNVQIPPVNKYVSGNVQVPSVNKYASGNVNLPPLKYVTNNINSNVPPPVSDGKYVPLHSLGYKLVMQEVSIEY